MTQLTTSFKDYNGHNLQLNTRLIIQKNMVQEQVDILLQLHKTRFDIIDEMNSCDDVGEMGILLEYWHINQEELQEAWGFPVDRNFHMFWELDKCTCPVIDNRERCGHGYFIHNQDCKLHGWE